MMTITVAQERFVEVAYPRALKAAHKAFKSWHERKRQDQSRNAWRRCGMSGSVW